MKVEVESQKCYMCGGPTGYGIGEGLTVNDTDLCDECYNNLTDNALALLEALETMVEMVEMNGFIRDYAMEIAREAIKKARGEE